MTSALARTATGFDVQQKVPVAESSSTFSKIGLYLYLLFIVSWFIQLGQRYPFLGAIRFDLLLVIAIAVLCALSAKGPTPAGNLWTARRFVWWLVFYSVLTLPFVEWPGSVMKAGLPQFFKAAVFCLFTAALVREAKDLAYLLAVFVGCQIFRVLEPLYLHVTEGYWGSYASMANWEFMNRLAGAPDDIVNPNGLAYVIVTTLAFSHLLSPMTKVTKLLYLLYLPPALWALTLTGSRTGLLALAIVIATIWWKSQRKVMIGVLVVTIVGAGYPFLPDNLKDRYASLVSSHTKNAGSASDRTIALKSALIVAMRRPLFGHGLGTSGEANANFGISEQPAHQLYAEVAEELGLIGLFLFVLFMGALIAEIRSVRRTFAALDPKSLLPATADALQVFLVMNITFSLASYGLSSYEWYLMAGLSAVLGRLAIAAARPAGSIATDQRHERPHVHRALQGVLSGSAPAARQALR